MSLPKLVCPKCHAENLPDARFCEICGAQLSSTMTNAPRTLPWEVPPPKPEDNSKRRAGPPARPAPPPVAPTPAVATPPHFEETATFPLYTVYAADTDEGLRASAEERKVALFGLVGKRTLRGPKPESYITLESMQWTDRVYVRVHGIYSSTYVVDSTFPISVGEETIEVEYGQMDKASPEKGTLSLPLRLRKVFRKETTDVYDERGEVVHVQLPPTADLKALRTVHPPLTVQHVQSLLDATLEWTRKSLTGSMAKLVAKGAKVEKEDIDVSDHEVILAPRCVLTYHNSKTGERNSLTFDSLAGGLTPSPGTPRGR